MRDDPTPLAFFAARARYWFMFNIWQYTKDNVVFKNYTFKIDIILEKALFC